MWPPVLDNDGMDDDGPDDDDLRPPLHCQFSSPRWTRVKFKPLIASAFYRYVRTTAFAMSYCLRQFERVLNSVFVQYINVNLKITLK